MTAPVSPAPEQQPPDIVLQMALILQDAWREYYALFGVEPHGNIKQMAALLELKSAGKRIAALSLSSETAAVQRTYEDGLEEFVPSDTQRLDWLDKHCAFVADQEYCIGPYHIGELRKMADDGIAHDAIKNSVGLKSAAPQEQASTRRADELANGQAMTGRRADSLTANDSSVPAAAAPSMPRASAIEQALRRVGCGLAVLSGYHLDDQNKLSLNLIIGALKLVNEALALPPDAPSNADLLPVR